VRTSGCSGWLVVGPAAVGTDDLEWPWRSDVGLSLGEVLVSGCGWGCIAHVDNAGVFSPSVVVPTKTIVDFAFVYTHS